MTRNRACMLGFKLHMHAHARTAWLSRAVTTRSSLALSVRVARVGFWLSFPRTQADFSGAPPATRRVIWVAEHGPRILDAAHVIVRLLADNAGLRPAFRALIASPR